jgi:hypothetical protein
VSQSFTCARPLRLPLRHLQGTEAASLCRADRKAEKIASYFDVICERLAALDTIPRDWIIEAFGERTMLVRRNLETPKALRPSGYDFLLVSPQTETFRLREELYKVFRGVVPNAFFGTDYHMFEVRVKHRTQMDSSSRTTERRPPP